MSYSLHAISTCMPFYLLTAPIATLILIKALSLLNCTGMDMHKNGCPMIQESAGIAAIISFVVHLHMVSKVSFARQGDRSPANISVHHVMLAAYMAPLDDIFELSRVEKVFVPFLLACCDVCGHGIVYGMYRVVMIVFSCNCVNILSGVNGVEMGQVMVVLCCLIIDEYIGGTIKDVDVQSDGTLRQSHTMNSRNVQSDGTLRQSHTMSSRDVQSDGTFKQSHTMSSRDIQSDGTSNQSSTISNEDMPSQNCVNAQSDGTPSQSNTMNSKDVSLLFMSASLPLLYLNSYPSKVFIGNGYLFFSGYLLTLINDRLLLPLYGLQIINTLLSLPQLLGVVHCPRHRMPAYDGTHLVPSYYAPGHVNMTLLNCMLVWMGPMNEGVFCRVFLAVQVAYCGMVMAVVSVIRKRRGCVM